MTPVLPIATLFLVFFNLFYSERGTFLTLWNIFVEQFGRRGTFSRNMRLRPSRNSTGPGPVYTI